MNWRHIVKISLIPWLFLVVAGLGLSTWSGMIGYYGWPEFLRRFVPSAALLYAGVVLMIAESIRRSARKAPGAD